ncbi:dynactin subunit 1 isoform X2 [Chrysoperla carnea]|uniref:dynactin subunit 1 isoform X2 n=1 Tax=Chrysoperla carnea TaxID=189513 RepID=UPI001D07B3BB|nr:dynactin subunit 1 isoform X2 [Chrysoperla carnea]
MSEATFKIGRRVLVPSKECRGTISYVGFPTFASGKWIGVILDEPKGKNDGTVKGQQYFQCEENCGIFLKQTQLTLLDEHGNPIESPVTTPDEGGSTSNVPKPRSRLSSANTRNKPPNRFRKKIGPRSSRISLTGSRQSLAGSRQSLAGSRSHLASPMVERNDSIIDNTPTMTSSLSEIPIPKRASFVETGFVETLKPQFTPGQSIISPGMSASSTVEEKFTNLQYQQEVDNLRSQVRDLTEKLETLKIKRAEDKEKLKDYDKTRLQLEQLIEFKTKIMESKASLQRELQRAKQEAREAIEAREQHAEEMADLTETIEMATLDKEMAEEKAETLQIELETARERIEELTLDLEIMKTEMQNRESGTIKEGDVTNSYEVKQLEQQNARLRETLVRMRDLAAHEKHEYQKLMKDMDQKKSEIAELGRTKEKLSTRVEEMEQQIADLQEQVDAALGAEEMIEQLGDRKMALEDRVKHLEEELADLEALQDMNEQLVESNAELEQDLREELDLAHAATREAIREKEAAYEIITDREHTINKFRELVQKLQQQLQDLQHRLETESNKPVSALEVLDFKKMFAETKAHTKAIDLELRQIETQQATEHVQYLSAYMPDTFMARGGDHDAILTLLMLPRLLWKSEILLSQTRDKFPPIDKIDREGLIRGHTIGQFTFRSRLAFFLHTLQAVLHKYLFALNTCKPTTLLKVGGTFPEMAAQEKSIDNLIDLLKRDQLDENVPTEGLERCINYFNTMYPLLLNDDGQLNHNQLILDSVKALSSALDSITVDATALRALSPTAPDIGDMGLLAQHIITTAEQLQQQLKLIRRRIPPDTNITNLGFKNEISNNLNACCVHAGKVTRTLQEIIKAAIQQILANGDADMSLSPAKLKEIAATASDKIYEQDDLGPVQSLKNSLALILTELTQIGQTLLDNEYDINIGTLNTEKPTRPVILRAQAVKKELEETKTLTSKLENREADIKELKRVAKQKHEELSEMIIRKELAEKKLGNVNKDYEFTVDKLQRKLDEAQNALKRKEKEFEETMDHLQADIDSLENEKGMLKEKVEVYRKKAQLEMTRSPTSGRAAIGTTPATITGSGASLPVVIKDSPLLLQEIKSLTHALKHETQERRKYQSAFLKEQLKALPPFPVTNKAQDQTLDRLQQELNELKKDLLHTLATPKVVDLTKRKPGELPLLNADAPINHLWQERKRIEDLTVRANNIFNKIVSEKVKRKNGGKIEADFTEFPSNEMSKALNETKPISVAEIIIPIHKVDLIQPKSAVVPLLVTPQQLHTIQKQFEV